MMVRERFEFDMLSAPVNATDRRALSEAWYSALYATRKAPQALPARSGATRLAESPTASPASKAVGYARARQLFAPARRPLPAPLRLADVNDRRTARGPLVRSIERTLFRSAHVPRRASFTLGGGDGRVHVVVQTAGGHVRLIAFCAPKARTLVASALAQIRWDLCGQGFDVHASVGGDL